MAWYHRPGGDPATWLQRVAKRAPTNRQSTTENAASKISEQSIVAETSMPPDVAGAPRR